MRYGYGYGIDPSYLLVLLGALLCMGASFMVKSTYNKYARVRSISGMTGAQAAQQVLHNAGIYDVRIEHISGELTDHYDPTSKVLRLSDSTYASPSVAAIGVAAHEAGHAVQHQTGYAPLKMRAALVPAANIGSKIGIPIILIGALLGMSRTLVPIGIWVFSLSVLFQLVTLPVEFDASNRALRMLENYGVLGSNEIGPCKKVLTAAAMTYVAAAASSIMQLLRLVMMFGGGRRRD